MVVDRSLSSRFVGLAVHGVIAVVLLTTIFPVLNILSNSVSETYHIIAGHVSVLPVGFSLRHYSILFSDPMIPRSFLNSITITLLGTAINLTFTVTMAYPLAKRRLPFRRSFTVMIVVTMFFSGGLIPRFMVVRALGMYDTYLALTVPIAISAFNLLVMRTFFKQVPEELEESAFLEGARETAVLVRIVLPLAKAGVATIALFYAVSHWNAFFDAMIYLYDTRKYPLQLVLRDIVMRTEMARLSFMQDQYGRNDLMEQEAVAIQGIKYGLIAITMLPMLVLYPFIQRYLVKGVMLGSLKD